VTAAASVTNHPLYTAARKPSRRQKDRLLGEGA
jgi:hypothetical protein